MKLKKITSCLIATIMLLSCNVVNASEQYKVTTENDIKIIDDNTYEIPSDIYVDQVLKSPFIDNVPEVELLESRAKQKKSAYEMTSEEICNYLLYSYAPENVEEVLDKFSGKTVKGIYENGVFKLKTVTDDNLQRKFNERGSSTISLENAEIYEGGNRRSEFNFYADCTYQEMFNLERSKPIKITISNKRNYVKTYPGYQPVPYTDKGYTSNSPVTAYVDAPQTCWAKWHFTYDVGYGNTTDYIILRG